MNGRHILCSIILVSLLIFQIGGTGNIQNDTNVNEQVFSISDSSNPVYHSGTVGTPFSEFLNVTSNLLLIQYDIEEPSVVSYNFSLEGISAASGVDFTIEVLESQSQYIPHYDGYSV